MPQDQKIEGQQIDTGELDAAFLALRGVIDSTGYGHFVTDEHVREGAAAVVAAVEGYRNGKEI